jgi:hypothetical protein
MNETVLRQAATWMGLVALVAACATDPTNPYDFARMSGEERQAAWVAMTPEQRRVLACKLQVWEAHVSTGANTDLGGGGEQYWRRSNTSWIDAATGVVPGMDACEEQDPR